MSYKTNKNIIFTIAVSSLGAILGLINSVAGMESFSIENAPEFIINGAIDGFFIALLLALFHVLISHEKIKLFLRQFPAALVILINSAAYILLILFGRAFGLFITSRQTQFSLLTEDDAFINGIIFSVIALVILKILYELSFLLGPKVMLNFFTGKYHKPRIENRYIMFLDLKNSTSIAEKIGNDNYLKLLDRLFFEMTEPLHISKGEIYKYVGDEAIITWKEKTAIDRICQFQKDFSDRITKLSKYFSDKYSVSPEFRAGLHFGEMHIAEIGDVKKEIAFIGDSVNTAARIADKCKEMYCGLLLSETAIRNYKGKFFFQKRGTFKLKGKSVEIPLYSIE